ncbi:MAG: VOC family protein [Patescibacteria group bacterium]|nr:VOC family protein [Patescibacteria group bacterium]
MIKILASFGSLSVDDLSKAKDFYTNTLGLKVDEDDMGLTIHLSGGGTVFVYQKDNHQPASYTALNFVVDDIDKAVEDLKSGGVIFEHYEGMTGEDNIARGISNNQGPDIAWFKDPAGNILSVLVDNRTQS